MQWTRLYRLAPPYEAEIVHARYVEHRFARHAHEHFVIGLVEDGVQQYTYRGARHTTPAGRVFFVNGGEPHTGEPATANGYVYRTLCLTPDVFRRLARDMTGRDASPALVGAVVADRPLAATLGHLHRAVAARAPALRAESLLLAAARRLIEAHTQGVARTPVMRRESAAVARVREYVDAHYADDISLAQLGALVSRSPFYVARMFSRQIGLPPHAYLESVRMRHARELLKAGRAVADVALAVGYADQSHFTNRFRSVTGYTPGRYRRSAR
jgi:AraC-like DNA-binding protein